MNMELPIPRRIIAVVGGLVAAWTGLKIANEEYLWPGMMFALLVPLLATYLTGIRPDALLAGVVILGYLVGNRGFAQLSIPGIPMLPGEALLGLGLTICVWQGARTKSPLIRRDPLNATLLLWFVFCTARLPFDFRSLGFIAVRDYAFVYYSLFFFLGQVWGANERFRRLIEGSLGLGLALTVPVTTLFLMSPELFSPLSIAGVPLIFVKGDVASSFMAAGVFWFGSNYARSRQIRWVALAALCGAGVMFSNSRAAVVAVALGIAILPVLGERRILKAFTILAAVGLLGLLGEAAWTPNAGKSSHMVRFYESILTLSDLSGTQTPNIADLGDKADNNRFRLVWWEAVLDQTVANGLWFGLGFGQDLADQFLRRYYADSSDEFNTRSPHNFLITLIARTGVLGLLCFFAVLTAIAARVWQDAHASPDSGAGARWLAPFGIFVAACFGVVLEGPMGAVVFWTLLGLLSAERYGPGLSASPTPAVETAAEALVPALPLPDAGHPPPPSP